jgi:hypothetical protein
MKEKIYISGPITGCHLEDVYRRFSAWRDKLNADGYEAVIPTENGLPPTATWEEHMQRDIQLLQGCDAIFMLDGWEKSRGCRIEFNIAVEAKIPIIFEKNDSRRLHKITASHKKSGLVS